MTDTYFFITGSYENMITISFSSEPISFLNISMLVFTARKLLRHKQCRNNLIIKLCYDVRKNNDENKYKYLCIVDKFHN